MYSTPKRDRTLEPRLHNVLWHLFSSHYTTKKKNYLFLGLRYTRQQRSAQQVAKSPVEHRSDGPSLQELPFLKAKWDEGEGRQRRTCWKTRWEKHENIDVYWFITISWDNWLSPYLGIWMLFLSQGPRRFLFFFGQGVFNRIPWPADGACTCSLQEFGLSIDTEFSTDGGSMKLDQRESNGGFAQLFVGFWPSPLAAGDRCFRPRYRIKNL